jgi:hypothetical protein
MNHDCLARSSAYHFLAVICAMHASVLPAQLVANGVPQGWDWRAAQSAARAGHVGLTQWLLPHVAPSMRYFKGSFLAAAAEGCPLSGLHALMCAVLDGQPPPALALALAATSVAAAEPAAGDEAADVVAETRGSREEWLEWGKEVLGWDRCVSALQLTMKDSIPAMHWKVRQ